MRQKNISDRHKIILSFDPPISGVGIGIVFAALLESYSRNPSLKSQLFSYAVLGFALAEAMGLFCLMVAFLLLFGV